MLASFSARLQSIARSPRTLATTVALALGIAGAVIAIVALTRSATSAGVPPRAPPFVSPGPPGGISAFDVQSRDGDRLSVQEPEGPGTPAGPVRAILVNPSAQVEVLHPATVAGIHVGDWLNIIGVPNQVKNFAIRWIVILPSAAHPGADGIVRSPAGFAGSEADPSPGDRPILGGTVTAVSDAQITIKGPQGPIVVDLLANAKLRPGILKLTAGALSDIGPGDRVAGDFAHGPAGAVLVFPASAR